MLSVLQEFKTLSNEKILMRTQIHGMKDELEKLWKGYLSNPLPETDLSISPS